MTADDPCLCELLRDDDLAKYASLAIGALVRQLGGRRPLPPRLAALRDLLAAGHFDTLHCESCCATSQHVSSRTSERAELGHDEDRSPHLHTRAEAAHELRVSVATVDRWAADGRLRSFKLGRAVRFRAEDVQALAATNEGMNP